MVSSRFKHVVLSMAFVLMGCGSGGSAAGESAAMISPEWAYATSTEVLGQTREALEKRLGKPAFDDLNEANALGTLVFAFGDCKVEYFTHYGKVASVSTRTDQACQPSLKGLEQLTGVKIGRKTTFADMPATLVGVWRGECIASYCAGSQSPVYFGIDGPIRVTLEANIDTTEKIRVRRAWEKTLGVEPTSTSLDILGKVTCGNSDQVSAGHVLGNLPITAIHFGSDNSPITAYCAQATQKVSIRGGSAAQ